MPSAFWTNPSVLALSCGGDPIEAITASARTLVFRALERGWKGPPFDPFALAALLGIGTLPSAEVLDARTIPFGGTRYRIEFNPDRPRRRIRYSVFHEIAHTIFPDCGQMIRNRGEHNAARHDDWQLETLCNVAAAEFLLPTGALGQIAPLQPSIDTVLELRERFEASAEAALLRIRRLTREPAMAFACHRERASGRYVVEYAAPTVGANWRLEAGSFLPAKTAATECTAIGYTAKHVERWPRLGDVRMECIGVAPIPHEVFPRVIGFVRPPEGEAETSVKITYLRGDATQARGSDRSLLLQVVNDAALTWGCRGFASVVRKRWPEAQRTFTAEVTADMSKLRLGSIVASEVRPELTLVNLVAQRGYGPSPRPRIRYGALRDCLLRVSRLAKEVNASVHMPRIGTGQAGGSWPVVEEIVHETLTREGIKVFVYDLPQGKEKPKAQGDLGLTN